MDEVLFDFDLGHHRINDIANFIGSRNAGGCPNTTRIMNQRAEKCKRLKEQKCIHIDDIGTNGNNKKIYIFKTSYIIEYCAQQYTPASYTMDDHNLPTNVLFVLKISLSVNSYSGNKDNALRQIIKQYTDHPEYFQPNCVEFERVCQQEYAEIERRKQEFEESTKQSNEIIEEAHRIIDENVSKKEYYASLEQRLEQIELEEERIREEKQKMVMVKERLLEMKSELAREREAFELEKRKFMEQKNKTIDIDKCFEDLL